MSTVVLSFLHFSTRELVVAKYHLDENKPCTAILDLDTLTWRRVTNDGRKGIQKTTTAQIYRYNKK